MEDGVAVVVVVAGLLSVAATAPGLAGGRSANEAPLVDAGLDQTASVGESVRLDATGSRDPDGSVAAYEWRIETPDGTTTAPACRTCATTTFRPLDTGRYSVTVTVTDDDGATRSDTLYLTVDPGPGPDVSVTGPTRPAVSDNVTYTADVGGRNIPLEDLTWRLDGSPIDSESLSGDSATVNLSQSFGTDGDRTLTAVVTDIAGQESTDRITVNPRTPSIGGGGGGGSGDGDQQDGFFLNGGDGSGTWVQTNDDGGPVAASSEAGAVDRAQTIVGDEPGLDAGIDRGSDTGTDTDRTEGV